MSYETQARHSQGTYWGDAFYEDEDDRASDDLNNELWDRLHELMRGRGILATILSALEELSDDRADRDEYRDSLPLLKFDYQGATASLPDVDRAIVRAFKEIAPRSDEIIARRNDVQS